MKLKNTFSRKKPFVRKNLFHEKNFLFAALARPHTYIGRPPLPGAVSGAAQSPMGCILVHFINVLLCLLFQIDLLQKIY